VHRPTHIHLYAVAIITLFLSTSPAQQPKRTPEQLDSISGLNAHHLCSGIFVVGRDYQREPAKVLAEDIAPFPAFGWQDNFKYEVDWKKKSVTVSAPGATPRSASYHGDQGCTILPLDGKIHFKPVKVPRQLPDAASQAWPMGDKEATATFPEVDKAALTAALDRAMQVEEQNTRSLVVVYKGKIIGERYAPGFTKDTPQIGWSQGKSITAALIAVLMQQGELKLDDPAPIAEWQQPDDPRRKIRIKDLLRMSSGLDFDNWGLGEPRSYTKANEHFRIYFDSLNVFDHVIQQPAEVPPNTRYAYRNTDPLTLGKIIQDIITARGEEYLTFPQRALFDKIGMRSVVLETDAWGNFILSGYDYVSARDCARFGLLHLQDGRWDGEQILPDDWTDFITTPAPADETLNYGGMYWLARGDQYKRVPKDAYYPAGYMGQRTTIIPSRDMVIVRLGPSPGGLTEYLEQVLVDVLASVDSTPGD